MFLVSQAHHIICVKRDESHNCPEAARCRSNKTCSGLALVAGLGGYQRSSIHTDSAVRSNRSLDLDWTWRSLGTNSTSADKYCT